MASLSQCLIFVAMISLNFLLLALAHDSGIATFYDPPYTPSACYGNKDHGVMIAAAGKKLWDGGNVCGQIYQVSCTGGTKGSPHPCIDGSITVKITDECPGCKATFDLSREAFAAIADPDAGVIKISYQQV